MCCDTSLWTLEFLAVPIGIWMALCPGRESGMRNAPSPFLYQAIGSPRVKDVKVKDVAQYTALGSYIAPSCVELASSLVLERPGMFGAQACWKAQVTNNNLLEME